MSNPEQNDKQMAIVDVATLKRLAAEQKRAADELLSDPAIRQMIAARNADDE